mmetsp:Transcript_28461/g.36816  ORF Transcript_28461/g.36816 Transcript_28461/m.36816 type:complete len:178 (-) Transcript_28461:246-779(-)
MADWQGPALCVYNNATFSSRDFNNLVKIGQASKLDRLVTTGRFGLGFNSVYHFTDCPTLVSGDSVVTFDPHVNFLPGATPSQPGIKIKFTNDQKVNNNNKNNKKTNPFLIMACDGIWDVMSDNECIEMILEMMQSLKDDKDDSSSKQIDEKEIAQRIVKEAETRGTSDNLSVIVIFF